MHKKLERFYAPIFDKPEKLDFGPIPGPIYPNNLKQDQF